MHIRRGLFGLLVVAILALAACSGTPGGGVNVGSVQTAAEQATGVKLASLPIPDEAKTEGVTAYLGNTATITTDLQVVQIFIVDSEAKVEKARQEMASSAANVPGMKVITHKTIIAIYAAMPGGTDKGAALEAAIKGL